jgi:hypothetical protein
MRFAIACMGAHAYVHEQHIMPCVGYSIECNSQARRVQVQARTRAVLYERFVMYYVWQCLHYCGGVCVGLNHGHAHTVHLQHYNTHFQCQR